MSNQEMQFADPDWKPSQQLDPKTSPGEREASNPQPINTDYREQNQWRAALPAPTQQEGYTGLRPYTSPPPPQMQGGNYRQRQYRRRGRGPWFWIILAIIIVSLMSGGFGSFNSFNHNRFGNNPPIERTYDYKVNGPQTIVINDTNGNVTVTEGQSDTDVTIQTMNENNPFGNPNDIQPDITQDANNFTATIQGSVDLQVTVPKGSNLKLLTNSGNINVTGIDGQMTLTTNDGNINASNDVISGSSSLTTTSGDIKFDGTIGTTGTYQFQTNNGNVDLIVPPTPPFHVDALTTSGSINSSDFPGVQKSDLGSGAKATGDVGGSTSQSGAKLIINVGSGDINLHQG
jgi:hypothetical protein